LELANAGILELIEGCGPGGVTSFTGTGAFPAASSARARLPENGAHAAPNSIQTRLLRHINSAQSDKNWSG
jgi:hypothetical protein